MQNQETLELNKITTLSAPNFMNSVITNNKERRAPQSLVKGEGKKRVKKTHLQQTLNLEDYSKVHQVVSRLIREA